MEVVCTACAVRCLAQTALPLPGGDQKNTSATTDSCQRATSRHREGAKERRERRLRAEARIRLQLCRDAVRIASHRRAHRRPSDQVRGTCTVDSPGIGYVTPAPAVTHATPAPVIEYVAPASVIEYITSAPAVTCLAPCELLPLETMATVNTDVSCDTTGFVNPQISTTAVDRSLDHFLPWTSSLRPSVRNFSLPTRRTRHQWKSEHRSSMLQ